MGPENELVGIIGENMRLAGEGRYLWCPDDPSLVVDARHGYFVWGSRGLRGFREDWETRDLPRTRPDPAAAERYAKGLTASARVWWGKRGLSSEAISKYGLGYCREWDTYTIPIYEPGQAYGAGELVEVKHCFGDRGKERPFPGEGKYGHEPRGGFHIFNLEALAGQAEALLVGGEVKAMLMTEAGFPAISSTGGILAWNPQWTRKISGALWVRDLARLYICFDPFEEWAAHRIASYLGERAWIVHLPCEVDKLVQAEGGAALFREYLGHAEPYAAALGKPPWHSHYGVRLGATNEIPPELWRWG